MKALVLHGPGKYEVVDDYGKPEIKPGWALVKVMYAGICGSDLPRFSTTGSYHHPMILGHEFMGLVDTPAPNSKKYKGGETVAVLPLIPCNQCSGCMANEPFHCKNYQFLGSRNDGGFAQYCLVPEENLFPLPNGIDIKLGVFIEPMAVALHVVRRSGFQTGQRALIYGAGSIGLLIALWLKVLGAKKIVIADIRSESLKIAKKTGFEKAVNPLDKEFSKFDGFDSVFEAAGSCKAFLSAIDKANDKSVITVVGRDTNDTIIPLKSFEKLMRKEIIFKGCWGYNLADEKDFVYEAIKQGKFDISALITQEVLLNDSVCIIRKMIDKSIFYCKVVIKI